MAQEIVAGKQYSIMNSASRTVLVARNQESGAKVYASDPCWESEYSAESVWIASEQSDGGWNFMNSVSNTYLTLAEPNGGEITVASLEFKSPKNNLQTWYLKPSPNQVAPMKFM